jgi:hypothetical protein
MSKRRRPARDAAPDPAEAPGPRGRSRGPILRDIVILVAAFGLGVGAAELLGAANLGVAFGVGQVVFAVVLVVLLTRD